MKKDFLKEKFDEEANNSFFIYNIRGALGLFKHENLVLKSINYTIENKETGELKEYNIDFNEKK